MISKIPIVKLPFPELKVEDILNGTSGIEILKEAIERANELGYDVIITKD